MLIDVMDMTPEVELAHRRLADFIWATDSCPSNAQALLTRITLVKDADWVRVKDGLEQKGWYVDERDRFTHKGIYATLCNGKEIHNAAIEKAKAGAAARWAKTMPKQCSSNAQAMPKQCQSESESESEVQGRKEGGHPSLEEVKAAASRSGMLERDAIAFWNHFESSGWIDKNRNPIIKWGPKMANWKASAAAAPLEANHRASESVSTASNVILWQTELKRVEQKISDIRANATRMAMGIEFTEVEVFNLKSLRERVTELKGKLGFQA